MFGGKDSITKESLLTKVSEYQIFKYYCPNFQEVGKKFNSTLRNDKKPSCVIYIDYTGRLIYHDLGKIKIKLDCFNYVKYYLKLKFNIDYNFNEILQVISNDLNLIKVTKNIVVSSINYIGLPDSKLTRATSTMRIKERKWLKSDTYFDDYCITDKKLLKFYNVKPTSHYWISSRKSSELFLAYNWEDNIYDPCYTYDHLNGLYKCLRPYCENKIFDKWKSNVPRDTLSGWEQLDNNADTLIVTKSLKDCIAWRLFGFNAVAPQSESIFMSDNTFELLKYRFKEIIINYDNDKAGLYTMESVKEDFNIQRFIFHSNKDISDSLYYKGFEYTKNIIKNLRSNLF